LLVSEPAGDSWVVDQLVGAARSAVASGAPEPAAVFLRRALAEPPAADEQSEVLVSLGVAEASAGLEGWEQHLQQAVDGAEDAQAAASAAIVLAHALNRSQSFAEAVAVLDDAAARLDSRHAALALRLEAAAVVAGLNDLAAAPSLAFRRRALRERV